MIEQIARVESLSHGYAWVQPETSGDSCHGCASGSCSSTATWFSSKKKAKAEAIYVANPVNAKPGDEVVVGMPPNTVLAYSLLAYLLPLLSMIVFAVLTQQAFQAYAIGSNDLGAALGGLAGLFFGFKTSSWLVKAMHNNVVNRPVILRHKHLSGAQPITFINNAAV